MVEIRGDLELRRLRGACLESCWKEQAVAKGRAQQPTSFRYQRSKTDPFEERTDADVLALVWQAAESTRKSLEMLGYVVFVVGKARTSAPIEQLTRQRRAHRVASVSTLLSKRLAATRGWKQVWVTRATWKRPRSKLGRNWKSTRTLSRKHSFSQGGGSSTSTWAGRC